MDKKPTGSRTRSGREQGRAALLEAAYARPGVREMMKVYDNWHEQDRRLDAYRDALKVPGRTATTNSSTAW